METIVSVAPAAAESSDPPETLDGPFSTAPPSPLTPGDLFLGKYRIESLIGAGGMGSVVLARHQDLDAQYAIKVMHASSPDKASVDRFKREARTSAMVEHPNIVRVFDCGEHDGHCYIIMEYLRGESLRERQVRLGRFTVDESVRFGGVVCDVLEVMHEAGIVHRDLKPDNIFYALQGKGESIKILDFGIAKLAASTVTSNLTQTGTIVGTPSYMSPEQCMAGKIDGRSDIYSLGVILFQMLTGRLPFDSDNLLAMMYSHVNQAPPVLHELEPSVPRAVSDVIARMMAKSPEDRFQSATSCAAALSEAAGVAIPIREGFEGSAAQAASGLHTVPLPIEPSGTLDGPNIQQVEQQPDRSAVGRGGWFGYVSVGVLVLAVLLTGLWFVPGMFSSPNPATPGIPGAGTNGLAGVSPILAAGFVLIPGGTITLGANEADCVDMDFCKIGPEETPSHAVSLSPFWIAKHEVTNLEYADFIGATGHNAPSNWRNNRYPSGTDSLPVTNVSWLDAVAFTEWRSKRDGIAYRLPTEQEWEYAARGDDARMFPWGNFWNASSVNSDQESEKGSPLPVDQSPNNTTDMTPSGVGALAGNVCEWTSTQFAAYPGSSYRPTQGDLACKVIRGGSFNTKPNASRTTYRAWQPADKSARDIGFRLAADASSNAGGSK